MSFVQTCDDTCDDAARACGQKCEKSLHAVECVEHECDPPLTKCLAACKRRGQLIPLRPSSSTTPSLPLQPPLMSVVPINPMDPLDAPLIPIGPAPAPPPPSPPLIPIGPAPSPPPPPPPAPPLMPIVPTTDPRNTLTYVLIIVGIMVIASGYIAFK